MHEYHAPRRVAFFGVLFRPNPGIQQRLPVRAICFSFPNLNARPDSQNTRDCPCRGKCSTQSTQPHMAFPGIMVQITSSRHVRVPRPLARLLFISPRLLIITSDRAFTTYHRRLSSSGPRRHRRRFMVGFIFRVDTIAEGLQGISLMTCRCWREMGCVGSSVEFAEDQGSRDI